MRVALWDEETFIRKENGRKQAVASFLRTGDCSFWPVPSAKATEVTNAAS